MGTPPDVVIVGSGFGGLAVARALRGSRANVTLIDRHNYTTFQPLLYQVATSGLNAGDVATPVRGMLRRQRNVRFRRGEVTAIDWARRELLLDGEESVPFDHLVLAAGATTRWFGIPGAAEWSFPLYTLDDAADLRNHIVEQFEAADAEPALVDDGVLTFVVVGGGPTGVETAGALSELVAKVFRRDYPQLDVGRCNVMLVELQSTLLAPFHEKSQHAAIEGLEQRGVELRLGESVAEIDEHSVTLRSGEVIPTRTVVWAAGVEPSPLVTALDLPTGPGGRVVVDSDLSVPDRTGVWAIGDVALVPGRDGKPLPQVAPVAIQSGRHAGRQIARVLSEQRTKPFRFRDKGTMATIGRRAAVAELPAGIRLSGTLAWLSWLGLHILYLSGIRNRVATLLGWGWSYLTWDRPRLILRPRDRRPAVEDRGTTAPSADGRAGRREPASKRS